MGGESTISQMIRIIKHNRYLLKRIQPFSRHKEFTDQYKYPQRTRKEPEITEEEMRVFRAELDIKKQQYVNKSIKAFWIALGILVVLMGLLYLIFF
jgi:hypothetical protein